MSKMLILLCDSPFHHESVEHAIELTRNSIEKGHEVDIYLMMDGVYNPMISQSGEPFHMESISDQIKKLVAMGAEISGCRVCMELRGMSEVDLPPGIDIGGIFDLSDSIAEADVVLSLTGAN
jgi:uncharacterized protein involved in oxidation of intracellular sulfur